jgi:hypothetical protein
MITLVYIKSTPGINSILRQCVYEDVSREGKRLEVSVPAPRDRPQKTPKKVSVRTDPVSLRPPLMTGSWLLSALPLVAVVSDA